MPNGWFNPDANTSLRGSPSSDGRSTRMRPEPLSGTNTSPLGATRIWRGRSSPAANRLAWNPAGTNGFSVPVRGATHTPFALDPARLAGGRSAGLM
jgi:hypothetical protein